MNPLRLLDPPKRFIGRMGNQFDAGLTAGADNVVNYMEGVPGPAARAVRAYGHSYGSAPGPTALVSIGGLGLAGWAGANMLPDIGGNERAPVVGNSMYQPRPAPYPVPYSVPNQYEMAMQYRQPFPSMGGGGGRSQPFGLPQLDEEDIARQRNFLERKIATDALTLQALNDLKGGGMV